MKETIQTMIRKYEPRDDNAIIDLWYAASAVAHPFLEPEFLAQEEVNMRTLYLPNTETWVAEVDGAVVGFVALMGSSEVGGLFLHPSHHGRGIGRALMDKAVELRGALELEVFKLNSIGRRFYDRYGFVAIEEKVHDATGFELVRLGYTPE